MDLVANVTDDFRVWGTGCGAKGASLTATYSVFFLNLLCIHLATKCLHEFLRRYGQPRIVSEFTVAMIVGNVTWIESALEHHVGRVLNVVGQFSMMCYMFVLGLEMKPKTALRRPGWDTLVAYAGVFSTFGVTFAFYPALASHAVGFAGLDNIHFVAPLALILSNTASPIITRLTTDLKIGKSHIGRLVVESAILNDMVMTSIVSVGLAVLRSPVIHLGDDLTQDVLGVVWTLFVIFAQTMFILLVVPHFAQWINERNPEGKPMKGFDLALSLAVVLALTEFASVVNFDLSFNSFLVGLAFPKEGRLTSMLISKINFIITTFGQPYFMCSIGTDTKLRNWITGKDKYRRKWSFWLSVAKLFLIGTVGTLGKVLGTFFAAIVYGFQFTEAIAIGLLLNVKGYFHILCAFLALKNGFIDENTFLVFLFSIISTVIFVPLVVRMIVKRARRGLERPLMTIQGLGPSAEVQIVLGILGPQNVPMALGIVEATRGQCTVPLTVYAMDLVEMTDSAAATLVRGQEVPVDGPPADEAIARMREETSLAFERYVQEGGEGLTVVRLLAISAFTTMHEDLCRAAQETASVFIIMPFHRTQRLGDGVEIWHPGLRHVNRKVLHHAPCSVGVLVDRGMGQKIAAPTKVAVIFIGGCDDREALMLAGRMACHHSFHLTVVRFLQESGAETKLARTRGLVIEKTLQEKEMHLDDECFAKFFENHIAGGRVGYLEKYIGSGADAVVVLKGLEGQYPLFIVGRGGSRNPVLTAGMGDWAECPELGPVGDILSSSDFSKTASALIIQQHDLERDQDVTEDDLKLN